MIRFLKILLTGAALLIVLATLLSALRFEQWWVRIFDYPRMQIAAIGLLVLVLLVALWKKQNGWERAVTGLLALSVVYQGYRMFPYTPLAPKQVLESGEHSPDSTFSLLVANVLMGNRQADALLEIIRTYDPDLFLALEPNDWWERQLRPLEAEYPYTLKRPMDNTYGMLLYSRLELVNPEIKTLVEDSIPSVHARVRLPSGQLVQFHGLHPDPPNPKYAKEMTERDAELLLVGQEVQQAGRPAIVAGDLNDVAWSHTTSLFQEISGLLDPRIGRGTYNTYNANIPFLRWPLDHVFHSEHFKLVRLERGPRFGSDHFPIFVELVTDPQAEWQQEEPDAEPEDLEQAREKIEEARRKKE